MGFFFEQHPIVEYDVSKTDTWIKIQNPLVRFRLKQALADRSFLYYTYDVQEGQTPQFIAHRYYGDETLDWVIYIVNDIIDPYYDWPLDYEEFNKYIIKKYGSVEAAQNETVDTNIHHYEYIVQAASRRYDGTFIPEIALQVDETTYDATTPASRRVVRNYTYEERLNDAKRSIKLLRVDYLEQFLNEANRVFS